MYDEGVLSLPLYMLQNCLGYLSHAIYTLMFLTFCSKNANSDADCQQRHLTRTVGAKTNVATAAVMPPSRGVARRGRGTPADLKLPCGSEEELLCLERKLADKRFEKKTVSLHPLEKLTLILFH